MYDQTVSDTDIAIIGMSSRLPGSKNTEALWQNLRDGVECIAEISPEQLRAALLQSLGYIPETVLARWLNDHNYVGAAAGLEDIDLFDAAFFGYNPTEAELLDPQQRIFLECAWAALEDAAYDPETYKGLIGVYAGSEMSTYHHNLHSTILPSEHELLALIGNTSDYLATRVSYKLNLKGPSLAVQSACSTSLVAIHLACQSLKSGECDIALAGGVVASPIQQAGYLYQAEGLLSPDGHCRPFDAQAQGTVFANGGVGIVVLKRLTDALEDGDNIYAVVKGSAINNDGALKTGYTAPGIGGQVKVLLEAMTVAEVDPQSISYIETHGTATPLGDPVEIAALTQAFRTRTQKKSFCAIGSIKSNMGHLGVAAGVAGLIKTALALKHKMLPPSLYFQQPNPQIDFANSPFYVNTKLAAWDTDMLPRRAGVSSIGIGGTNAHVILEEAPSLAPVRTSKSSQLFILSAKTGPALEKMSANLRDYLERHADVNLSDLSFTLQVGRRAFPHRLMFVCRTVAEAINQLEAKQAFLSVTGPSEHPVVFLFPDQGWQYVNAGRELYEEEPTFRSHIDTCAQFLIRYLHCDLRDLFYPVEEQAETAQKQLHHSSIAQAAIFVIEYAIAQLWIKRGIHPQAMIGQGIGEYVAACLTGVFSLQDALFLVALQGRLMEQPLNGAHASHTPISTPLLEEFTAAVRKMHLHPPRLPSISNLTGTWITEQEATNPDYWARHWQQHWRQAVSFAEGVQLLLTEPARILLEMGPGHSLSTVGPWMTTADRSILPSLRHPQTPISDAAFWLNTCGRLWCAGAAINWSQFYAGEQRRRISLPTYPFEGKRYWVFPERQERQEALDSEGSCPVKAPPLRVDKAATSDTLLESPTRLPSSDWFSVPGWRTSPALPPQVQPTSWPVNHCWVFFLDDCGVGSHLIEALGSSAFQHAHTIEVRQANDFRQFGPHSYGLDPAAPAHYEALFDRLHAQGYRRLHLVHLWTLSLPGEQPVATNWQQVQSTCRKGFYSVLALVQALHQLSFERCQLTLISNGIHQVLGSEDIWPEKALLLGPCLSIPQEYPDLSCRYIDLQLVAERGKQPQALLTHLREEITAPSSDQSMVALRGARRWLPALDRLPLSAGIDAGPRLRNQGVYLITGGLGGLGLELAHFLARRVQARLVLVGRSALPPRAQWGQLLDSPDTSEKLRRQLLAITRMEAQGTELWLVQADVTNVEQMQEAIKRTLSRFGALHGVIHAAGVPGVGLMQFKTPQQAASVLAPKVQGTLVLQQVLTDLSLDFLVLFSSLTSWLGGGPGQVDYTAANAFLDAYAQCHAQRHGLTLAIDWAEWQWNSWQEGLQGYDPQWQRLLTEHRQRFGISFEEGCEAFVRLLSSRQSRVLVCPQEIDTLAHLQHQLVTDSLHAGEPPQDRGRALGPRPSLASSYRPPTTGLEQALVSLWEDLLGIGPIGIDDNFFELGGNSLLGISLVARIRSSLRVEKLPAYVLYEAPSVAQLAQYLEQGQSPDSLLQWQQRGEKRRAGLSHRSDSLRQRK